MTRAWDEFVAAVFDVVGPRQLLLLMFLTAAVCAALWYWFPAWVPRRLPRWRRPRMVPRRRRLPRLRLPQWRLPQWRLPQWRLPRFRMPRWDWRRLLRRRRRPTRQPLAGAVPGADTAPVPEATAVASGGLSAADRLAAQGRYAEAIRERLREAVGDLVDAGVVAPQPGWTAAELAAVAATTSPAVAHPLEVATALFSEIWYGQRPALPAHDQHMRALTGEVRAVLHTARGGLR